MPTFILIGVIKLRGKSDLTDLKAITRTFKSTRAFSLWTLNPDLYPDHEVIEKKAFSNYSHYEFWMGLKENGFRPIPREELALAIMPHYAENSDGSIEYTSMNGTIRWVPEK